MFRYDNEGNLKMWDGSLESTKDIFFSYFDKLLYTLKSARK
jgi:hypothetical protein